MDINIEQLIKEYEENRKNLKEYDSYINHVREYKGYMFKEIGDIKKFNNEAKWLKKLEELNFYSPKIICTYNQTIITEKINAKSIKDEEAKGHLYNIGKLIGKLHNLPIKSNEDWKEKLLEGLEELKKSAKNVIEENLYKKITNFLDEAIKSIDISENVIIHKDIRPENILNKDDKYYLLDFESMNTGDRDYDFIRMLNIFNQKQVYQYEDFKDFMDGYKSIREFYFDVQKWNLYSKYYAFRMYTRMLSGKVNRDAEFEAYLENILKDKNDRISEWIIKYNNE